MGSFCSSTKDGTPSDEQEQHTRQKPQKQPRRQSKVSSMSRTSYDGEGHDEYGYDGRNSQAASGATEDEDESDFESSYEDDGYSDEDVDSDTASLLSAQQRASKFPAPSQEVYNAMQNEVLTKTAENALLSKKVEELARERDMLRQSLESAGLASDGSGGGGGSSSLQPGSISASSGARGSVGGVTTHQMSIDATSTIVTIKMAAYFGFFNWEFIRVELTKELKRQLAQNDAAKSEAELDLLVQASTQSELEGELESMDRMSVSQIISTKAKLSEMMDKENVAKIESLLEGYKPNDLTFVRLIQVLNLAEKLCEAMEVSIAVESSHGDSGGGLASTIAAKQQLVFARIVVLCLVYSITTLDLENSKDSSGFVVTRVDYRSVYESVYLWAMDMEVVDSLLKSLTAELVMIQQMTSTGGLFGMAAGAPGHTRQVSSGVLPSSSVSAAVSMPIGRDASSPAAVDAAGAVSPGVIDESGMAFGSRDSVADETESIGTAPFASVPYFGSTDMVADQFHRKETGGDLAFQYYNDGMSDDMNSQFSGGAGIMGVMGDDEPSGDFV